tara:strand:- start:37 stop:954 length:918 start_codon:yes stop_codon:yes gene_type:complete
MGSVLIMRRGDIIFAGCSFTWGQGLWSYSPTKLKVPTVNEYLKGAGIPEPADIFRMENRWASEVAQRLHSREIIKRHNGGTDEESIRFIDEVKGNNVNRHSLLTENVIWEKVKGVIFQTTQAYRSGFEFFQNGSEYCIFSESNLKNLERVNKIKRDNLGNINDVEDVDNGIDIFLDWLIDNNHTVEDFEKLHTEFMSNKILNKLKNLEKEENIPTLLICWTPEYLPYFLNDKFASERLVKLKYNGKEFNTISCIIDEYKELEIQHDSNTLHDDGGDGHPSLECNRIIRDAVLDKINERINLENNE